MNRREYKPDNNINPPASEAKFDAPLLLMDYLRSQFEAAYQKETSENEKGITAPHGSFYHHKHVAELAHGESELTTSATRIVLKPPFTTYVISSNESFAEVYAIFLRGEDGHEVADDVGTFADQYLVRVYEKGVMGPYELVTEEGCFLADLSEVDDITGIGILDANNEVDTISKDIDDIFRPIKRANELLQLLESYNIVATDD